MIISSWKKGLVLAFLSFLLTCLALEVALRIHSFIQIKREREKAKIKSAAGEYWPIYDPDLGYRLNPKFGDHNPDGLRDHPITPKGSRFRILFLGDSIIYYGENVDDTIVGHMRSELRTDPSFQNLDIIDAGIKGYTNYQELLYLKKYGLKFQPDLVGVEFCLNDIPKFLHSFVVEDGKIVRGTYRFSEEPLNAQKTWYQLLLQKSFLITWMDDRFRIVSRLVKRSAFPFERAIDIGPAWADDGWNGIEIQTREFVELGRRHHFNVFFVVFPVALQYKSEYLERDRNYTLKPQRKLREICRRLSVPFYDLYPELSADFFTPDGIHLTNEGRSRVGQLLARFLARSNLLPSHSPQLTSPRGELRGGLARIHSTARQVNDAD